MEEKLKSLWEKKLQRLQKDSRYAVKFTEILLEKFLKQKAEVEELYVRLPQKEACTGELAVLDVTARIQGSFQGNFPGGFQEKFPGGSQGNLPGILRNMEIIICREILKEEPAVTFLLDYYCVEAPAILVDSGSTTLRFHMGSEIEECLQEAEYRCKMI